MFGRLFSSLTPEADVDSNAVRRRHSRRDCDKCVSVVNGKTYPVENWSLGGLLITADERLFKDGDEVGITLKFRLREKIIDVAHMANVIRKSNNKVAFQFKPISQQVRTNFQNVVDDYVASQFAASQTQLH